MALDDWQPIRGDKARRYVNTDTGEITSRRGYLDIKAKNYGWNNYRDFQNRASSKKYLHFLRVGAEGGTVDRQSAGSIDSEFNRLYAGAKRRGFPRDAKGKFHDFLVYLDLRDDDDWWDIGDTGIANSYVAAA